MEIKPADKEIIDHKDLRYKRKVSNKGIKEMNKQAYEHTVGLVLSKQAGANEIWDAIKGHVSNNRLAYLGGATGAVLGAVSAIGGPWWRYLASGGAGAAVGAGIGFAGDRMRNRALNNAKAWESIADGHNNQAIKLSEENSQLNTDRALLTQEANDLWEENDKLKKQVEKLTNFVDSLGAANGAYIDKPIIIPNPVDEPTTSRK